MTKMARNKDRKKKGFSLFKLLFFLLIIGVVFFLVSSLFGNGTGNGGSNTVNNDPDDKDFFTDYFSGSGSTYSSNWKLTSNIGKLDTSVASGVRPKRTEIYGAGYDEVTIMLYMCGSDLEAQASMGLYDLQEMATATIGKNVNLLVYTGGTTKWHLSDISTTYNQIYKVLGNGQIDRLVDNAGTGSMVDPDTLVSFIEWSVNNFPANRYELILWDHGGGSVSGYGYDLKYPNLGSMGLAKIDKALTEAGVSFDFIGFDACLMANTETALMLSEHADYLIASEESEPGIGWYYTEWLTALSNNTSIPTVELGKIIADSFVTRCKKDTPSQSATLSVIDLAEMQDIIPAKLTAFSKSTNEMINSSQYKTVANARGKAKEFARQNYVDLVDLIDMANNLGTNEAKDLITSLLSCIKYNNTTSDMANSFGLSVYFPYRSTKYVSTVLNTYNSIDMNAEYSNVVRNFASYATAGQASSGGSHNAYQSFNSYGSGYGSQSNSYDYYYNQQSSADSLFDLLDLFMGGGYSDNSSYSSYYADDLIGLLFGRGIDRSMVDYIAENHFDADLTWKNGKIALTEKQWSVIDDLKFNVFVKDEDGYIDLGKDNVFHVDKDGALVADKEFYWLAASADNENWQVVPYYYLYSIEDGDSLTSYGRIPVMLNTEYANLIVMIDNDGKASVIGAAYDYRDEQDIVAKNLVGLNPGDALVFICDHYDFDGTFSDTYFLGDALIVTDELHLGDVEISEYDLLATYEFTDIYGQSYWTTPIER